MNTFSIFGEVEDAQVTAVAILLGYSEDKLPVRGFEYFTLQVEAFIKRNKVGNVKYPNNWDLVSILNSGDLKALYEFICYTKDYVYLFQTYIPNVVNHGVAFALQELLTGDV